jgi:hypothetical protein
MKTQRPFGSLLSFTAHPLAGTRAKMKWSIVCASALWRYTSESKRDEVDTPRQLTLTSPQVSRLYISTINDTFQISVTGLTVLKDYRCPPMRSVRHTFKGLSPNAKITDPL